MFRLGSFHPSHLDQRMSTCFLLFNLSGMKLRAGEERMMIRKKAARNAACSVLPCQQHPTTYNCIWRRIWVLSSRSLLRFCAMRSQERSSDLKKDATGAPVEWLEAIALGFFFRPSLVGYTYGIVYIQRGSSTSGLPPRNLDRTVPACVSRARHARTSWESSGVR